MYIILESESIGKISTLYTRWSIFHEHPIQIGGNKYIDGSF